MHGEFIANCEFSIFTPLLFGIIHERSGNMEYAHNASDLKQMQALPLDAKIAMTKQRIKQWYDAWYRVEIVNKETGKVRHKAVRDGDDPKMTKNEYDNAWYQGGVYLSFSGGKDSTVLKHIVDSMYSDVPAVFVNTGLEYPEIQKFVKEVQTGKYVCFNSDIEILRPEMRFDDVIKTYGYPLISKEVSEKIYEGRRAKANGLENNYATRQFNGTYISKNGKKNHSVTKWKFLYDSNIPISHLCCDIMKKNPSHQFQNETGRVPIVGTMASESQLRRQKWIKHGCNAFDTKNPQSNPLSFWTENDVIEYIQRYNVPYASVYGDIVDGKFTGAQRTGCIFCAFGAHLEKEPNRFQRLKETHPNQYSYCMKPVEDGGLGMASVLDYIGVKY